MMISAISWKVPQSQLRLEVSISELSEGQESSLQGYEKSCTRWNFSGVGLGMMPNGNALKGLIKLLR